MPHQRERETCARSQHLADTLAKISAEILTARDLATVGAMAAQVLKDGDEAEAVGELLNTIAKRLMDIAERTERASRPESATDAA